MGTLLFVAPLCIRLSTSLGRMLDRPLQFAQMFSNDIRDDKFEDETGYERSYEHQK